MICLYHWEQQSLYAGIVCVFNVYSIHICQGILQVRVAEEQSQLCSSVTTDLSIPYAVSCTLNKECMTMNVGRVLCPFHTCHQHVMSRALLNTTPHRLSHDTNVQHACGYVANPALLSRSFLRSSWSSFSLSRVWYWCSNLFFCACSPCVASISSCSSTRSRLFSSMICRLCCFTHTSACCVGRRGSCEDRASTCTCVARLVIAGVCVSCTCVARLVIAAVRVSCTCVARLVIAGVCVSCTCVARLVIAGVCVSCTCVARLVIAAVRVSCTCVARLVIAAVRVSCSSSNCRLSCRNFARIARRLFSCWKRISSRVLSRRAISWSCWRLRTWM